jgi:hypothetical protein
MFGNRNVLHKDSPKTKEYRMAKSEQEHEIIEPGYSVVLDQMDIPRKRLSAYSKPVDLTTWPRDGVVFGGTVIRVTGKAAGLPQEGLSAAKFVSMSAVRKMNVRKQGSGLFLVDIDFVPRELADFLKSNGLTLKKDGALHDQNNDPVVGFVTAEVFQVRLPKTSKRTLKPFASPFPFTCFGFLATAFYHETGFGGNHRWYDAHTFAVAGGPDASGGCSAASPHTRIDYMQARAAVREGGDFQQVWGSDQVQANDVWDVGYFWPAHGVPVTTHSAIWADGSFSFSRTASLTW